MMTIKLKKLLITILSAGLLICAAFLLFPRIYIAKADTSSDVLEENRQYYNADFRFANPSAYNDGGSPTLYFPLALDGAWINQLDTSYDDNWGNKTPKTQARFEIGLYTKTDAQNAVKVRTYTIIAYQKYTHIFETVHSNRSNVKAKAISSTLPTVQKNYVYQGKGTLFDFMTSNLGRKELDYAVGGCFFDNFNNIGNKQSSYGLNVPPLGKYMGIILTDISPNQTYYVDFTYEIRQNCWYTILGAERNNAPITGHIASKDGNLINILTTEYQTNEFSERNSNFQNTATGLLRAYNTPVSVRFKYLVDIEGTPFAKAVTETVTLPGLFQNEPTLDDFLSATGRNSMILNRSTIYNFEYDPIDDIYVAKYRDSIYLSAKTSDGESKNYFLDLNKSYDEYYNGFVRDGVFGASLYRYLYNQIILRYRQVETIPETDLYGFFGFVVIPSGGALNELWKEMFDKQTTFSGQLYLFDYNERITPSAYNKLLNDYDYPWLQRAWKTVTNTVSGNLGLPGDTDATYYLFYVDSFSSAELWIGENSAEDVNDNSSQIGGDIVEVTSTAGNVISKIWSGVSSALDFGSSLLSNGWVILAVIAAIIVLAIILKNRNNRGGGRRRR